jgi:hypothetical protein
MADVKTEVKKVEKTAESSGFQNVGSGASGAPTKTFAQVRAEREASGEASNAVAATAYPESQPKGDAKPSPRTQREMTAGSNAMKARK